MSNDPIERDKLKKEIMLEVLEEIEHNKRNRLFWTDFKNNELIPFFSKRYDIYESRKIIDALAKLVKYKFNVKTAISFKGEDIEEIKEQTYKLIEFWFGMKINKY